MASQCTIQHTNFPMAKQKGKEEIDGVKRFMLQIDTTISFMEPILTDAFGFEGLALFVRQCNGSFLITRSGYEIVNALLQSDIPDPVSAYLLKFVKNINCNVGDNTKKFIFYVHSFIKLLSRESDIPLRLNQLKKFQSLITLAESSYASVNKINSLGKIELNSCIKSFFLTRFTEAVADLFSEIVFSWIMSYPQENYSFVCKDVIKFLLDNINVLCIKNCNQLPLSDTTIQHGFVIKGKINGMHCNMKQSKGILKVFPFSDEENIDALKNASESFESDIIRLIVETKFESDLTQIILVTNTMLSESILFYLRIRNVISIEGVLFEDVKFLHDYILKNYLTKEFVTDVRCESNSVLITIPEISQLIICSPTKDLGTQLRDSLINFFSALNFAIRNGNIIFDVNGNFEVLLYQSILNCKNYSHSQPPKVINSRKELLEWHRIKSLGLKRLYKPLINDQNHKRYFIIDSIDEHRDNLERFVRYLTDCIFEKSVFVDDDFIAFFCDVLYYIVRKIKSKDCEFNSLELVSIKLSSLNYAIDFISSVYNIDSVLHFKRQL